MPPRLRVATPDEKSSRPRAKPAPKTTFEAAEKGTPRELLEAMRARVAKAVDDPNTPARDLSSLTRRLLEITRDIEAIDARAEQEANASADIGDAPFDASAI